LAGIWQSLDDVSQNREFLVGSIASQKKNGRVRGKRQKNASEKNYEIKKQQQKKREGGGKSRNLS